MITMRVISATTNDIVAKTTKTNLESHAAKPANSRFFFFKEYGQ